jgi:hypothetical protein
MEIVPNVGLFIQFLVGSPCEGLLGRLCDRGDDYWFTIFITNCVPFFSCISFPEAASTV